MDLKILLIAIFVTTTIYYALKANKYKTMCEVMKSCFKKRYGYDITTEEMRQFAKDELEKKFRE